jgi:predicted membrane-bound dolichyl-phosphate-mannose-protein mannosyltransferase
VTGVIGAGAVAFWFLVLDAARGQPFYTPAALGAALLIGATSPIDVQVTFPIVAAYTVLHILAFAAIGIAVEWAAERIERAPAVLRAAILAFVLLEALFIGVVGALSQWVLGAVGYWAVAVGNVLALASMSMWILATHPKLRGLFGVTAGTGAA